MTKKISPHNKNNKLKIVSKNENIKSSAMRLKTIVITVLLLFMILIGRIVYIEFFYTVDGKKLKEKAYLQSTQNKILTAKRGTIFDRNGKTLALSADVDTITVNPAYLKVKKNAVVDQTATNEKIAKIADKIVELFGADKDTIINKLKSNKPTETLVSKVEKTKYIGVRVNFDDFLKNLGVKFTNKEYRQDIEGAENGVYTAEMAGEKSSKTVEVNDTDKVNETVKVENEYFYGFEILSNSGYSKGNSLTIKPQIGEEVVVNITKTLSYVNGTLENANKDNIMNEIIKFNATKMNIQMDEEMEAKAANIVYEIEE